MGFTYCIWSKILLLLNHSAPLLQYFEDYAMASNGMDLEDLPIN